MQQESNKRAARSTPERVRSAPSTGTGPNPATEERDEIYGVTSILYHALQGVEAYARFIEDARRDGDQELVEFLQECRDDEIDRVDRAKQFLATRLGVAAAEKDEEEEEEEEEDEEEP